MGPGVVIVVWLFIAAVYCAFFGLFCVLFFVGWIKKWIWLRWIAGLPAACMLLLAAILVIGMTYGIIASQNPKSVFKTTFEEEPSQAISDIQSSLYWFADTGSVYLRFKTTESEFRRLVPKDLSPRTSEQMEKDTPMEVGSHGPTWWTYQVNPEWIYFLRDHSPSAEEGPSKRGFYSETEYFAFDPATQTAYYRFLGID